MIETNLLIIVPTLNSYKLLHRLVESLQKQTFKNWRVIFIDADSNKDHINYLNKIKAVDNRFSWKTQEKKKFGIYGAMNQGLNYADRSEWVLFWGSDDWAVDKKSLSVIVKSINTFIDKKPYLIISKTKYFDLKNNRIGRKSIFLNKKNLVINSEKFQDLLFLGYSPPHQGTIFSPDAIANRKLYNCNYKIASDLDYFLRISSLENINIFLLEKYTVIMGLGGFSSLSNLQRFKEVINIYYSKFGFLAIVPFFLRYFRRLISFLKR